MSAAQKVEQDPNPIFLRWDPSAVIQDRAEQLREEDDELSEDDALKMANEDPYVLEGEWEHVLSVLQEKLDEYNSDGLEWRARVERFGWRNLDGQKTFRATDSKDFLSKLLPETECIFNIYVDDKAKKLSIRNWHHDSPMGSEWYYIEVSDGEEEG